MPTSPITLYGISRKNIFWASMYNIRKDYINMSFFKNITPTGMLTAGLYAGVCHATGIWLYFNTNPDGLSPIYLVGYSAGMLEYTFMSLLIVTVGAFLLYLAQRDGEKR